MSVGLPTSTPFFQMAAMYGVRPDIPGFHYHDKTRAEDVYFPRAGDAAEIEARQAAGRVGILRGGSAYGCVFTGGAADHLWSFASVKQPSGASLLGAVSAFVVLAWVIAKGVALTTLELGRASLRFLADPVAESQRGFKRLLIKVGVSVWMRELFTLAVARDLYRGLPAIYVNYLDYDVFAHAYGPEHPLARRALIRVDRSLRVLARVLRRVPECRYDLHVLSDHGQILTTPFYRLNGGRGLGAIVPPDCSSASSTTWSAIFPGSSASLARPGNGPACASSRRVPTPSSISWTCSGRSRWPRSTHGIRSSSMNSHGDVTWASCWHAPRTGPCAAGVASASRSARRSPARSGNARTWPSCSPGFASSWPCRARATS
jgi:hypothetical protein